MVMVHPTGGNKAFKSGQLDCLTNPKMATQLRQPRDHLANPNTSDCAGKSCTDIGAIHAPVGNNGGKV